MGYTHNLLWFIAVEFWLRLQERGEDKLAENSLIHFPSHP